MFEFLNSLAGKSEWIDIFIIFSATLLPYWVVGAAFIFFLRSRKIILEALVAVILSRFFVTEIIRLFYNRPRPFDLSAEVLTNAGPVYQLFSHDPGYAFPSGHAAFFFALAATIFLYRKGWGSIFFGAAFLISLSRVIAGVHWTSDIFAGAVIGIVSAWVIYLFNRSSHTRQEVARKKASI